MRVVDGEESVNGKLRTVARVREAFPAVIVENERAAITQQGPNKAGVRKHVSCLVRTIYVNEVEGAFVMKMSQHLLAWAGEDGDALFPRSDVGDEAFFDAGERDAERNVLLATLEGVDNDNARSGVRQDVFEQPTGSAAFVAADFEDVSGVIAQRSKPARPIADVIGKPVVRKRHRVREVGGG